MTYFVSIFYFFFKPALIRKITAKEHVNLEGNCTGPADSIGGQKMYSLENKYFKDLLEKIEINIKK